jgi:hypothetical protein
LSSSPLVLAATKDKGAEDILVLLVKKCANMAIIKCALARAVTEGRDHSAAIIVEKCTDSEALRKVLYENLYDAVQRGLVQCVIAMMKKGVNPNQLRDVSI